MEIKTTLLTPVEYSVICEFNVIFLKTDDESLIDRKLITLFQFILDCFNEERNSYPSNILSLSIGKNKFFEINFNNVQSLNSDFRKIICEICKEVYKSKYETQEVKNTDETQVNNEKGDNKYENYLADIVEEEGRKVVSYSEYGAKNKTKE